MKRSIEVREATIADATEVARLLSQLGHLKADGDARARLSTFLEHGQHALVARDSSAGASAPRDARYLFKPSLNSYRSTSSSASSNLPAPARSA